ncbi:MAG: fasciclin domain-containing protein, partial [Bacteroidales bacterium]|nr:fasciclin domain-containing protein [Bacteroidales bacterium]
MKIAKCHNRGLKKQALERSFIIMPLLMALLFLGSCSKNFDSYYQRPSWLEKNALEVLEEKGNFSHYLKLVNRTLYSKVLSGSGHYTFFAPNDQAFEAWLLENNYEKVEDIPLNLATEMVAYSLIYNAYEAANLGNTWLSSAEWELGSSFRKQTPSYKTIFKEEVDGQKRWTMHSTGSFNESWHNYRYLPVFSNNYFTANGLSATDYNEFYQETDWNP